MADKKQRLIQALKSGQITDQKSMEFWMLFDEMKQLNLVKDLEVELIKGEDGKTPTDAQLLKLIKPLIPKPDKGEKGDTGKQGKAAEKVTKDELLAIIRPLIDAIRVPKAEDIARLVKLPEIPTMAEITKNIPMEGYAVRDSLELLSGEERLSATAIKGLPEYTKDVVQRVGWRGINLLVGGEKKGIVNNINFIGAVYSKVNGQDTLTFINPESDPVWVLDKPNYSTKAVADTLYKPIGYSPDLSAYLTSANAALIYQPIGSYLTIDQTTSQTTLGILNFPDFKIPGMSLGTPTYSTINDFMSLELSSGRLTGMTLSDHSPQDGTLNVSSGTGMIKITDTVSGQIKFFNYAGGNVALTDQQLNYIYIDYNGGTPIAKATTNRSLIHNYDQFTIGRCFRKGNDCSDITNSGTNIYNEYRRIHNRLVTKYGFDHWTGSELSESDTRKLKINAGKWGIGNTEIITPAVDTNVSGDFETYYYNGTAWVNGTGTQLGNTQYNDITTGLVTMTNNKWANYWVYLDQLGDMYVLYGQQQYNSMAEAQATLAPGTTPTYISSNTRLIDRITFQKSATNFAAISSYLVTLPTAGSATNHNQLAGLQGGAIDEYYHLTSAKATVVGNTSGTNTGDETAARIATINHGTSAKVTLLDADEVTGQDSANSFSLIRTTWTNVKAFLKTYFDTLYTPTGITYWLKNGVVGETVSMRAPFAFNWLDILAITSGTATSVWLDIYTDTDANFPPTGVDSIFKNEYTGTATSASSGKLIDTNANFQASVVGMVVFNSTSEQYALVTARDSATQLSLNTSIMASGNSYQIKILPSLSSTAKGTAITQFKTGKESVAKGDFVVMKDVIGNPAYCGLSCNVQKT